MSKIRIKNFGPIKEGYLDDDGWIDIKKVTVFIGNQGSGKSTVAKLISTLSWLEKSINRGDIDKDRINFNQFKNYFKYQGIDEYFSPQSTIEYIGEKYKIINNNPGNFPAIELVSKNAYSVPKIMYVPAERNFLSTIQDAFGVKGLPEHLFTFAEELKKAQKKYSDKRIDIPINNLKYEYDDYSGSSYISGSDHRINLLYASSGFQSFIPLYLVTRYLANLIRKKDILPRENMSVSQSIRMNEELASITLDKTLSEDSKQRQIKKIQAKYINQCFINIVEEPEQNLFPTSQRLLLNNLLKYNNWLVPNKLLLTTHSPYIINYLTLAVKAYFLKNRLAQESIYLKGGLKNRLNQIVPLTAVVNPENLSIYEFDGKTGSISRLNDYNGLPSDENQLNEMISESNELFAKLLEIQQSL
jgi:energy-coupling factor transporter ATP-binding protein EcfA2